MALAAGTKLGPFEIRSMIGEGGMGEVYRAADERLGRDVALKILPVELASDTARMVRFSQEARSASGLNHPNIVTIYDVGQSDEMPYIAMELVDGITLRALAAHPVPIRKALQIATQLAEGLAKAHAAGIVHRDLKPENVMVTKDGFVKILDFGLAKLADGAGSGARGLTATGLVVGTADYMSPEQAMGKAIDFRSDQFALGLLLYELVTGRRPFVRPSVVQTLTAIIQDDAEPVEKLNPRVPPPFCWLIERCLAKDPEDRYASTADLARDLKQLRDRLAVSGDATESRVAPREEITRATKVTIATPPPPRTAKDRAMSIAVPTVVALGLLALGGAIGWWVRGAQMDAPAPRYDGEMLLGGATRVFAPLVSPDGQRLAFLTLVNGVAQVAVMTPGSGDWVVLTKRRDLGSVNRIDWARDGARIYFDRVSDIPAGIFSIPAVGGDERLVLPDAQGPEALPDGSLLALRVDAERNFQLERFQPESGKTQKLGPAFVRDAAGLPLRAFPDGREAILYARPADGSSASRFRAPYVLSIETGQLRRFAPELALAPPFTATRDGRGVIADLAANDVHRLVEISRSGDSVRTLVTLTSKPWYVSAAADGTLFVALIENPVELLRFAAQGGVPERLASAARATFMHPVAFADGRVLLPGLVSGRKRLLAGLPGEPLRPFVETAEPSSPPVALVGDGLVAFLAGGANGRLPMIALASSEGRVVKRFDETKGVTPLALAASRDGKALYYVDAGSLYRLELAGGAPRKLRAANGVAVDPRGGLVVQLDDKDGVRLVRVPEDGGAEQPITTSADLRLSPSPIAGNAVAADGTIVVSVSSKENWFTGPALLSPDGSMQRVAVKFEGNILPSAWGGGAILGMGEGMKSELWRFRASARGPN